ncbi:glycosyltransferase [Halomarina litorea]|uniref:glycosyltransferase n=1 Tax=Halomarina litorea TaxID=2961595 RepID=UPI0020C5815B|nr:glycosyltransferase family A protein [Halomarina sp. BCD28]
MIDPDYSVCLTHYNQGRTLERSLESILAQCPPATEVVVVDAGSDDGSLPVLRRLAAESDALRLIVDPGCNRGEGRQRALVEARGEHVIANYDFDQEYGDILGPILDVYHDVQVREGPVALRTAGNLFFAPRTLLLEVGGYRPIMRGEDHELTDRLEDAGKLRYLPVLYTRNIDSPERTPKQRLQRGFRSAKGLYRIGFTPAQLFRFLYTQHSLPTAVAGTPVYLTGILAGALAGRVYNARRKDWREIFEMSARPTYRDLLVEVPPELAEYAVTD